MKLNKLFLIAGMALMSLSFASCSDDDDYTPGKEPGQHAVGFLNEGPQKTLPIDATSFTFTLVRESGEGALTVPLTYVSIPEEFSAPESVTFADGETEATVTVDIVGDMPAFEDFWFEVKIPEEFTNQYKETKNFPSMSFNIAKEDYVPRFSAVYGSIFIYAVTGDASQAYINGLTVEYSEFLKLYRIKSVNGTPTLYFKWTGVFNGEKKNIPTFTNASGKPVGGYATGWTYGSYGTVYFFFGADENGQLIAPEFVEEAGYDPYWKLSGECDVILDGEYTTLLSPVDDELYIFPLDGE